MDFEEFKKRYQKVPVEEYPNRVVETMPEPMVSVHVSTYQHADFIHDCMEGVMMQETDFPVEIIIGEDESDDGTREICKEYAEQYPERIRLFLHRRENNVAIHGRPTGRFQTVYSHFMARGKYIAICEGDDYWTDPKKLQKQVGFLEENPECVLTHHDAHIVNARDEVVERSKLPNQDKRGYSREELIRSPYILTLSILCTNVIDEYPKEYMEVLNGDNFLISMLGQYGGAAYTGEVNPAKYRLHSESMWSSKNYVLQSRYHSNTSKKISKYYKKIGINEVSKYFEEVHLKCRAKELKCLCSTAIKNKNYIEIIKKYTKLARVKMVKDGLIGLVSVVEKSVNFFRR